MCHGYLESDYETLNVYYRDVEFVEKAQSQSSYSLNYFLYMSNIYMYIWYISQYECMQNSDFPFILTFYMLINTIHYF